MTASITSYTNTDAIRAAVAVTDNEISDTMLTDQHLDLQLTSDMDQWLPNHASLFATGIAGGATSAQVLVATNIKLYALWFCAYQLIDLMRLGVPQQIGDGKSIIRRFTGIDFDVLAGRALARMEAYKTRLSESQGGSAVGGTGAVGMARIIPAVDPVSTPGD